MNQEAIESATKDVEVVFVVAVAENGVIGKDGAMPWHYPEDLAFFKETTMGHPVVMGRHTYESIEADLGCPLPGRQNVVLTRSDPEVPEEVHCAGSVVEGLEIAAQYDDRVYVIGGETVYEALLPYADELLVTLIPESPAGDTWFPEWPPGEDWEMRETEKRGDVTIRRYGRT